MQIAVQNDAPIIVRNIDFESQCCCGVPCVEWTRWANRTTPIYANAPPPSFPCCGLLQSYSISAEWTTSREQFRLVGSIIVSAVLDFPGGWSGRGGTLQVSFDGGSTWFDWFEQPGIAAIAHRGASSGGACQYEVNVGGGDTFRGSFFLFVGPRAGPIGGYSGELSSAVFVS